ncbi:hypothetical protein GH714_040668 [Hevea brasiliensis]|uniref:Conserved oligomeric Golgi complex subunit 6 n=1 Tax=Hevea brasiliensis TaxID=3981 RepID=A0A6A6MV99_HEVBR|nr:hypothetical protein GH714_040668 [Hevea brasiliensis]
MSYGQARSGSSLHTLSTFYSDNSPQARRNLRSTIEKRSLSINLQFLQAYNAAQLALDHVEEEVNALAECCDKIAKALNNCSASTGDIISTTERLKQELEITTQRQEIVSCFLRDYQLSNEEINALRDEELNEISSRHYLMFKKIHANCKILLRTHHQNYQFHVYVNCFSFYSLPPMIFKRTIVMKIIDMRGPDSVRLELMDMMAVYQEGAYERLCRAARSCGMILDLSPLECEGNLILCGSYLILLLVAYIVHINDLCGFRQNVGNWVILIILKLVKLLKTAVRCLKERPVLFKYCAEEALASERELVLVLLEPDAVIDAGSSANQLSKNLENGSGKTEADSTFVLDRILKEFAALLKLELNKFCSHSLVL